MELYCTSLFDFQTPSYDDSNHFVRYNEKRLNHPSTDRKGIFL